MAGQVKIVKGHLVPDQSVIRELALAIGKEVRANPDVAQQLRKNPRAFLGARGLPIDVQRELLQDAGLPRRRLAVLGGCGFTCFFSCNDGCCFTCWETEVLFPGGKPPVAKA